MKFDVVPDHERPPAYQGSGRPAGPLLIALLERKTLFVPGEIGAGIGSLRTTVKRRGLVLRTRIGTRGGERGMFLWVEETTNE